MTKTNIRRQNWLVETDSMIQKSVTLTHNERAGNKKESVSFFSEDFLDLYNLIIAIAQIHPEWINTN